MTVNRAAILLSLACPTKHQITDTQGVWVTAVGRPDAKVHDGVGLKKEYLLSVSQYLD
jgi:hypothetical protein